MVRKAKRTPREILARAGWAAHLSQGGAAA